MMILEKLDFLIQYLLKENREVNIDKLPTDITQKKNLYRSLCNIREPKPISKEYLEVENAYLQEELKKKDIIKVEDIETISEKYKTSELKNSSKICLWEGDITTLQIEAIVNAANSQGLGCFVPCHKCIDNQIHTMAGVELRQACNEIMKKKDYQLKTGEAIITKGYNLPAKYVIHAVGPMIYDTVTQLEEQQLADCYINSLQLAMDNGIRTIAFPCISTGEFRFPKEQASKIAIATVDDFLKHNSDKFEKVVFNVFTEDDKRIYEKNIAMV